MRSSAAGLFQLAADWPRLSQCSARAMAAWESICRIEKESLCAKVPGEADLQGV